MTDVEARTRALHRIFDARSTAVVGASQNPQKWGYMILEAMISAGYDGNLYPVNPKAGRILGLPVYRSVGEVPGSLDLVVVAIPAPYVPGVLREAADKGVGGVVVVSGGFREVGRADLEAEIGSICRERGLRMLGPNMQGIIRTPNKLCALPWPVITTQGPLTVISQSGSVTTALCEWAAEEGLGISAAVNLGNQVDLCASDLIEFFAGDPHTGSMAVYLEGTRDGRRLLETLTRAVRSKPIVVLKSGRTAGGQKAVASHTGSLAGSDEVFSAACRQSGVVRANDVDSLYAIAKGLATMGTPRSNRVFVITTSGGSAALFVDEAERGGLVLPPLPQALVERLKALDLPTIATLSNPLDLTDVSAAYFRQVVPIVDEFDVADTYLLIFADPVPGAPQAVEELRSKVSASLAVAYFGGGKLERPHRKEMQAAGVPVFRTPESAARGIAAAVWAAERRKPPEQASG